MKVRVAVSGCLGRMGSRVARFVISDPDLELVSALEREDHPNIGEDVGELLGGGRIGIKVTGDVRGAVSIADILVEFTNPEATMEHLKVVRDMGKKMVIGTTGFSEEQIKQVHDASRDVAILISPNMSIGVNVIFKLIPLLVRLLGEDYDIEIVELHHNKKKDAPSGTAKRIAELIREVRTELNFIHGRSGLIGTRKKEELGIHALRLGDIVGEHRIIFAGNEERIELLHSAGSRNIFARGAILALKFLKDKGSGLYTMQDVLAERLKDEGED